MLQSLIMNKLKNAFFYWFTTPQLVVIPVRSRRR